VESILFINEVNSVLEEVIDILIKIINNFLKEF